jgi:hypothetical protein
MAGYSGTPLVKKLGIRPDGRVALVHAPAGFALDGVEAARAADHPPYDVIVAFFTSRDALAGELVALTKAITPSGGLWLAWPKKASKVPTDVTEDVLRALGLPLGVVDNKVCAIDEVWSGLRFVWRKENR